MEIEIFELVEPTEENRYCVFSPQFEDDENIFFHMTAISNKDSIITNGFRSAQELKLGELASVSYANRSSSCFANLGTNLECEHIIFVVRFESDALKETAINPSDIHVYKPHLQPEILGAVHIPPGFRLS